MANLSSLNLASVQLSLVSERNCCFNCVCVCVCGGGGGEGGNIDSYYRLSITYVVAMEASCSSLHCATFSRSKIGTHRTARAPLRERVHIVIYTYTAALTCFGTFSHAFLNLLVAPCSRADMICMRELKLLSCRHSAARRIRNSSTFVRSTRYRWDATLHMKNRDI